MSNWTLEDLERKPGVRKVSDSRESGTRMQMPQGKGKGGPRNDPEGQQQREFFHLVRSLEPIYPQLQMVRSDQAGLHTHPAQAQKAKAAGMRPGFPDIDVPVLSGGYSGLNVELKYGTNRPTQMQRWWLQKLEEQGRRCVVCYSAHEAWKELVEYLGLDFNPT